jgi:hypothetical protein
VPQAKDVTTTHSAVCTSVCTSNGQNVHGDAENASASMLEPNAADQSKETVQALADALRNLSPEDRARLIEQLK